MTDDKKLSAELFTYDVPQEIVMRAEALEDKLAEALKWSRTICKRAAEGNPMGVVVTNAGGNIHNAQLEYVIAGEVAARKALEGKLAAAAAQIVGIRGGAEEYRAKLISVEAKYDALAAKVRDAKAMLATLADWRERCHNYDEDMGHTPREWDGDTVDQMETEAQRILETLEPDPEGQPPTPPAVEPPQPPAAEPMSGERLRELMKDLGGFDDCLELLDKVADELEKPDTEGQPPSPPAAEPPCVCGHPATSHWTIKGRRAHCASAEAPIDACHCSVYTPAPPEPKGQPPSPPPHIDLWIAYDTPP